MEIVPTPPARPAARAVTLPPFDHQPVEGPEDPQWATLSWPDNINAIASSAELEGGMLMIYLVSTSHMPLYLYILLGIAGAGIVFVVLSHNRRAKRIMLPIANTAFHLVVLLVVFSGDARLRVPRPVAVIRLLANAVLVQWMVLRGIVVLTPLAAHG